MRKLDWKQMCPFTIRNVVSPYVYELRLSTKVKLHPVFHVSLLDPAPSNAFTRQYIAPPTAVIIDEKEEYELEEILNSELVRKRPRYYVK